MSGAIIRPGAHQVISSYAPLSVELARRPDVTKMRVVPDWMGWMLAWAHCGLPVLRISPGLASRLLLTDPSKLTHRNIHWPFPALILQLDAPQAIEIEDEMGRPVPITHIMADRQFASRQFNEFAAKSARLVGKHEFGRQQDGDLLDAWMECAAMKPDLVEVWYTRSIAGDHPGHLGVHQSRQVACSTLAEWMRPEDGTLSESLPMSAVDHAAVSASQRLLVNALLWFAEHQSVKEGLSHNRSARRRQEDLQRRGILPSVWRLGVNVTLDKNLFESARAVSSGMRIREPWRLKSRFVVRGHWRQQVFGLGRGGRRLVWIEPYWKGPVEGVGLSHLYEDRLA
jgi:hypothetical protein